jgi:hypothetical protein
MRTLLSVAVVFCLISPFSHSAPSLAYIEKTLMEIASDQYEGRTTESGGSVLAQNWIINQLQVLGVFPAGDALNGVTLFTQTYTATLDKSNDISWDPNNDGVL